MARVKDGSHSFTCHPYMHPRMESNHTCLYFPGTEHYALLPALISCLSEGRRLSWPEWLVT